MRSKIGGRPMMVTADQALERIRPDLASVIAVKEQALGSRMRAYEALGSKIGRSPTWIRKVLGRAEDVTVGLHDALNIRAAYERLCARVEAVADTIEAGNEELRRELDAALGSDRAGSARMRGAPRPSEAPAISQRAASLSAPVPAPAAPLHVGADAPRDLTDLPLFQAANPRP